jgi:uncharacterized RDD family membrane protein YckC
MKKQKLTVLLLAILFLYFLVNNSVSLYYLFQYNVSASLWIITIVELIFLMAGITGLLQYHFSAYKYSKLLRLYLSFCCLHYPLNFGTSLLFYLRDSHNMPYSSIIIPILLFVSGFICFYSLFIISKARKPQFIIYESEALVYTQFEPVRHSIRFLNRFVDVGVLLFLIYSFYESFPFLVIGERSKEYFLTPGYICLIISISHFYYYFILEALFKITIGKIVTNTSVVNEEGAYNSVLQALGRTCCRFIPFEPFSFLFGHGGWHDSISNTYVIKERYDWELDKTAV